MKIEEPTRGTFKTQVLSVLGWSIVSIPIILVWSYLWFVHCFRYKGAAPTLWENLFAAPILVPLTVFGVLFEAAGLHPSIWLGAAPIPLVWGLFIHWGVGCLRSTSAGVRRAYRRCNPERDPTIKTATWLLALLAVMVAFAVVATILKGH